MLLEEYLYYVLNNEVGLADDDNKTKMAPAKLRKLKFVESKHIT